MVPQRSLTGSLSLNLKLGCLHWRVPLPGKDDFNVHVRRGRRAQDEGAIGGHGPSCRHNASNGGNRCVHPHEPAAWRGRLNHDFIESHRRVVHSDASQAVEQVDDVSRREPAKRQAMEGC